MSVSQLLRGDVGVVVDLRYLRPESRLDHHGKSSSFTHLRHFLNHTGRCNTHTHTHIVTHSAYITLTGTQVALSPIFVTFLITQVGVTPSLIQRDDRYSFSLSLPFTLLSIPPSLPFSASLHFPLIYLSCRVWLTVKRYSTPRNSQRSQIQGQQRVPTLQGRNTLVTTHTTVI